MVRVTKCAPGDGQKGPAGRTWVFRRQLQNGVVFIPADQTRPAKASRTTWAALMRADDRRLQRQYHPRRVAGTVIEV